MARSQAYDHFMLIAMIEGTMSPGRGETPCKAKLRGRRYCTDQRKPDHSCDLANLTPEVEDEEAFLESDQAAQPPDFALVPLRPDAFYTDLPDLQITYVCGDLQAYIDAGREAAQELTWEISIPRHFPQVDLCHASHTCRHEAPAHP